jgi:hypothetical protein
MAQTRTIGVRSLLAIAHVLIGPFCAGLVFIAFHVAFVSGQMPVRRGDIGLYTPIRLLVDYIKLTPIFYAPGFLPALTTALLTASQVRVAGSCTWLRAATYGAVASVFFVGLPSLVFLRDAARSWEVGYPATVVAMLGFQAMLGFVGTIPAWFATGRLRRRLAEARSPKATTPASAE